jgi:hypothetical protein
MALVLDVLKNDLGEVDEPIHIETKLHRLKKKAFLRRPEGKL